MCENTFSFDPATRRLSQSVHDPDFYADPFKLYRMIHEWGDPVWWEEIGCWCFAGHEQVNALLRDRRFGRQILPLATDERIGSARPAPHLDDFTRAEQHSLLNLEPPAHTRLRTLVNRAFVSRQIERLEPEIRSLAHQLIDGFEERQKVELLGAFGAVIPVTIIARMLGVPQTDGAQLLAWSHAFVRMYMPQPSVEDEHAANRAAQEFSHYLSEIITDKRRRPADDLLSRMIAAEIDGERLKDDELISTTILLLNAGHEATVHQIGNTVHAILAHEFDPEQIFSDADTTSRTIEESLRFLTPLHLFKRFVLEDCVIAQVPLRRGEEIGLLLAAANRDPDRYANPDRFDPMRRSGGHLAFGAGLHFCIGAPLARLELASALPVLFARLPGLRLVAPPRLRDSYHFYGLEQLWLEW